MTEIEEKQHHLELIQGVINRLSHNSFLVKGWTISIVSGLLALGCQWNSSLTLIAYLPALSFFFLDNYYLYQEKLYRKLYDQVRIRKEKINYSLNTTSLRDKISFWKTTLSPSIWLIHLFIIFSIAAFQFIIAHG